MILQRDYNTGTVLPGILAGIDPMTSSGYSRWAILFWSV